MNVLKNILSVSLLASHVFVSSNSAAVKWQNDTGIEDVEYIHSLRIVMNKSALAGHIDYRSCKTCDAIKLNITPETVAYAKGEKTPLSKAADRLGRHASLTYEKETNNVLTISW